MSAGTLDVLALFVPTLMSNLFKDIFHLQITPVSLWSYRICSKKGWWPHACYCRLLHTTVHQSAELLGGPWLLQFKYPTGTGRFLPTNFRSS